MASGALGYAAMNACNNCESSTPALIFGAALLAVPVGLVFGIAGFQRRADCEQAWHTWCAAPPAWARWAGREQRPGPSGARGLATPSRSR